jgi:hypothetical protein
MHWQPDLEVTVIEKGADYVVSVQVKYDDDGAYATGVAVRRDPLVGYKGGRTEVSPREVKRLPLARIIGAALAYADVLGKPLPRKPRAGEQMPELVAAEKILSPRIRAPRGRPQRGGSAKFYKQIAEAYRQAAAAGLNPIKEIARQNGAPENTVHQWIHRARRLNFLEPSPRSKPPTKGD